MKIKLAQMRVKALNVKDNYKTMIEAINKSIGEADLIVFPQNALLGMMHSDRINDKAMIDDLLYYQDKLVEKADGIALAWGGIDRIDNNLYQCIYFVKNNVLKKIYKRDLRDDKYYSESKYYALHRPNQNVLILDGKKVSFSFLDDEIDAVSDINIVIDSSFWYEGVVERRIEKLRKLKGKTIYINHVGMQNNGKSVFVYDGTCLYLNDDQIKYLSNPFEEQLLMVDLDKDIENHQVPVNHLLALKSLIKYYDDELFPFKPNWIIGLSGGLDSSVSLALLVNALGADRVIAVNMPSRFNQETSRNNASKMAEILGVEYLTVPVESLAQETVDVLAGSKIDVSSGLAYENIQARLRGHILMSIASVRSGVIVNNGNKLESAFGYATMYGDAIGALSVLGDLNKMEVSNLARLLNEDFNEELVPHNLIAVEEESSIKWGFAPSAELAHNQLDPMKWGYHDYLLDFLLTHSIEELMSLYLNGEIYKTRFGKYMKVYGLDDPQEFIKDLEWVIKQLYGSIYKRIQMPPIAVMSMTAFGTANLESQYSFIESEEYSKLRDEILSSRS